VQVTHSAHAAIMDLSKILLAAAEDDTSPIRVFRGLDSGFQINSSKRFWAVYAVRSSAKIDIFISDRTDDLESTIIHTYLTSRGCTRQECFEAEIAFSRLHSDSAKENQLSQRICQDIHSMSPSESLLTLQSIELSRSGRKAPHLSAIFNSLKDHLLSHPTTLQLKETSTFGYLSGQAGQREVISARMVWHRQSFLPTVEEQPALELFNAVEIQIQRMLKDRKVEELAMLTKSLTDAVDTAIYPSIDILILIIYCVLRKAALEEIYLEVTDRNPLFNDQSDQAAAFAELFALGSRCEAYFDMSPSEFGKLLSQRYREWYCEPSHQPQDYKESTVAMRAAYSEAQFDADTSPVAKMPSYQRFSFLSVFAIPALVDIILLSTTQHGLYLSAKMTDDEKTGATIALMISLLLSGAIGTWISCGGTYYLASMAFSAMNYFVVTRLLGGFIITIIFALVGFIIFGIIMGPQAGVVFFLYLIALTSYLSLLAALANYNFTGYAFQSVSLMPTIYLEEIC